MKAKILAIAAMTLAGLTICSCNTKTEARQDDSDTILVETKNVVEAEKNDNCPKNLDIERKTEEFCKRMIEAIKENNLDKMNDIHEEMSEWQKTLSKDEKDRAVIKAKEYDDQITEAISNMTPN